MFIAALPAVCTKDSCCFDFGCICSFLAVHKVIRCCSDTDLQFSCHLLETKAALLPAKLKLDEEFDDVCPGSF